MNKRKNPSENLIKINNNNRIFNCIIFYQSTKNLYFHRQKSSIHLLKIHQSTLAGIFTKKTKKGNYSGLRRGRTKTLDVSGRA